MQIPQVYRQLPLPKPIGTLLWGSPSSMGTSKAQRDPPAQWDSPKPIEIPQPTGTPWEPLFYCPESKAWMKPAKAAISQ